jgi:hypothetical protein
MSPTGAAVGVTFFGVLFLAIGVVCVVLGLGLDGSDRSALVGAGLVFALFSLIPLWRVPGVWREAAYARGDDGAVVEPGPAPDVPADGPWPVAAVAQALGNALQGSGYRVMHTPHRIRIDVDVADQSWWVLATKRGLKSAYAVQLLMTEPGRVIRSDFSRKIIWRAGVPSISGEARFASGRVWQWSRQVEYSVTPGGVRQVVDVLFSTKGLNETIGEVLREAGWMRPAREGRWGKFRDFYDGLDSNAKGALMMAGLVVLSVPVVLVGLLVKALMT